MKRLIIYYKRVLSQKYLYFHVGKLLGVSIGSRLIHNFDLLSFRYANEVSKLIYNKDGTPRDRCSLSDTELDRLINLIDSHKSRSSSCIEHWLKIGLVKVPEEYIRRFIADRYADCGLDNTKFLTSIRDLFCTCDYTENSYNSQVQAILESLVLEDR